MLQAATEPARTGTRVTYGSGATSPLKTARALYHFGLNHRRHHRLRAVARDHFHPDRRTAYTFTGKRDDGILQVRTAS